jgi:hypothetical protein
MAKRKSTKGQTTIYKTFSSCSTSDICHVTNSASPEGIKLVVFYYLIVFEMWPEKRVGLYWEWSYSLFRTFGHLTIEGSESSKNPWDFAFYLCKLQKRVHLTRSHE